MSAIYYKIISSWQGITFGTKFVILSSLLCYIIDYCSNDYLFKLLENDPQAVLNNYQWWRILIPQFFHGSVYSLMLSVFCFCFSAIEFEKSYGTVPFFYDIFLKNIIIQLVFIFLCFLMRLVFPEILMDVSSYGFWSLTMMYMINKALQNSDEPSKFLCLPLALQAKYYPIIFFILLNVLEFPRFDMCAAILLAIIEYQFFEGFVMKPSKNTVNKLEESILFARFQSRADFITCDQVNHAFIFKEEQSIQYNMEIQDMHTQVSEQQENQLQ